VLSYFRDKEPLAQDATLIDAPLGAQMLSDAVNKANENILDYAHGHAAASGMGTTLVAARFDEGKFTIAHVGDSRIYLMRNGNLLQLTEDHSLVMEQVRRGIMTLEEARHSTAQHIITRALGTEDNSPPDLAEFPAELGDVLVLTTDGVLRHLEDPQIHDVLRAAPTRSRRWRRGQRDLHTAPRQAEGRKHSGTLHSKLNHFSGWSTASAMHSQPSSLQF